MEMLFENLNYMHWLVLGLALVIIELFLWSVFLLWIGASAITVSIIFYLTPETSGFMQLLIFVLLSISLTYLSKKYYPVKTVDDQLNNKAKSHIGKECEVISIEGLKEVNKEPGVEYVLSLNDLKVGDILEPMNYMNRLFYLITVSNSPHQAIQLAESALATVKIETLK